MQHHCLASDPSAPPGDDKVSQFRINAYFMHESEKAAAQRAVDSATISEAEWTPGYVMGWSMSRRSRT